MRPLPVSWKMRSISLVPLDRIDHFSPGFSWFSDATWCNLTCISIFRININSFLVNHNILSHNQAIIRAENLCFSTIFLHDLAERRDRSLLEAEVWTSRLGFKPQSWDLSLETGIWASRLGFEPWGWDLRLEAGIWALRLGFEPLGWDLSLEAGI